MREQVQAQVGVGGVGGRGLQVVDDGDDRPDADVARGVGVDPGVEVRHVGGVGAQRGRRVPDVEDGVAGEGGQSEAGGPAGHGRVVRRLSVVMRLP